MKCWLCLRLYETVQTLNVHVLRDHPIHLNEEQTYVKVIDAREEQELDQLACIEQDLSSMRLSSASTSSRRRSQAVLVARQDSDNSS